MIYFPTAQSSSSLPSHISMLGLRDEYPSHICWTSHPTWSLLRFVPVCFLHFILLCSLSPCSVLVFRHSLLLPLCQFALPSPSSLFSKVCWFHLSTSEPQLMPNLATLLLTPVPFGALYFQQDLFKTFFLLSPLWKWPQLLFCISVPVFIPLCFFPKYLLVQSCMRAFPADVPVSRTDLLCLGMSCHAGHR